MNRQVGEILRREWRIWRTSALPGLVVIGLIVLARLGGYLQFFEWMALDYLLRSRPAESIDERLLIVGINEADIRRLRTYPVPDQALAELLQRLQADRPSAIGVDIYRDLPVNPGNTQLNQVFRSYTNIIGIEQTLPNQNGETVNPPPALPPQQIGFADGVADNDGNLRRVLLTTADLQGKLKFSLPVRLTEIYLSQRGAPLDNGILDRVALRFGQTELSRFQRNTGGYVRADAEGNQMLLNFRSGRQPFRVVSLTDVLDGKVPAEWIRDRVVLVGMMAVSVKDVVSSMAIDSSNSVLLDSANVYGVEIHAHTVSQIISAALDQRPGLKTLPDIWEYLWIIAWGVLGISIGRITRSPLKLVIGVIGMSIILIGSCYGVLLLGWWIPLVPAWLALLFNGAGLTAALFYRHEQDLRTRQMVIDQTFHAIHNGPLQILAGLLRQFPDRTLSDAQLQAELYRLNHELRTIYDFMRRKSLLDNHQLYLSGGRELDLQGPLDEVLYEVYSNTLKRAFPHFQTLRVRVPDFGSSTSSKLNGSKLNLEQKRQLCRFLEEALCNVGKHAQGVTQLEVICRQEHGKNYIRITDNGAGIGQSFTEGQGTQQAKQLAQRLKGNFRRSPHSPHGTICELSWSA